MLLWIEGFEGGGTTQAKMEEYITRRYSIIFASTNMTRSAGRFGGNSIRLSDNVYFGISVSNKQTIILGVALKFTGFPADEAIIQFRDDSVLHVELQTVAGGDLRLTRGSATTLGTTSGLGLLTDTWYYIELKLTIDDTTGAYELRVNGTNELSATSVDTNNGGNDYITNIRCFGDSNTYNFYYDDIYVIDTTGSVNNDFLGNMKITMISPNGDTADADFTPSGAGDNYVEVDDGVTVDDDATYVETSNVTDKDIYDYSDVSGLGTIQGVQISTECRETDATNYTLETVIKSGATESADTAQAMGSTYSTLTRVAETDPNTSSLWTDTNLNAAQFGYEAA